MKRPISLLSFLSSGCRRNSFR